MWIPSWLLPAPRPEQLPVPTSLEEIERAARALHQANDSVISGLDGIKSEADERGLLPIEVLMSRLDRRRRDGKE